MRQLTFEQHLLLMEAANELTRKVRARVAAGETCLQDTLTTLETIENIIAAGTVYIEPALHTTISRTTDTQIGEAA